MSSNSRIEWTDSTWNPVTGCDKVSPGCKFCYAEVMAQRLMAMGSERYRNAFELTVQADVLRRPLRWRKPRTIFVNSMSDLFHEELAFEVIAAVFHTMVEAHWHTFQVLTKRSRRLSELASALPWPKNIWMGVTVETQRYVERIAHLRSVPAAVRFLSLEPLLGPLPGLPLDGIDWVIVGGESGRTPRPMAPQWVRDIRSQCADAAVPFFFKQWGGRNKKRTGRTLDGRTWDEMPVCIEQRSKAQQPA